MRQIGGRLFGAVLHSGGPAFQAGRDLEDKARSIGILGGYDIQPRKLHRSELARGLSDLRKVGYESAWAAHISSSYMFYGPKNRRDLSFPGHFFASNLQVSHAPKNCRSLPRPPRAPRTGDQAHIDPCRDDIRTAVYAKCSPALPVPLLPCPARARWSPPGPRPACSRNRDNLPAGASNCRNVRRRWRYRASVSYTNLTLPTNREV